MLKLGLTQQLDPQDSGVLEKAANEREEKFQ
jgi:hypothetical protein